MTNHRSIEKTNPEHSLDRAENKKKQCHNSQQKRNGSGFLKKETRLKKHDCSKEKKKLDRIDTYGTGTYPVQSSFVCNLCNH